VRLQVDEATQETGTDLESFVFTRPDRGYLNVKTDTVRARWYGQPGIFRPKPYGIEYRTPDNNWTSDTTSVESVAIYGMSVAEFLTNTPADRLQAIFRSIPWVEVRKYVSGEKRGAQARSRLINIAKRAGMEL
jgi:hypothetical protein